MDELDKVEMFAAGLRTVYQDEIAYREVASLSEAMRVARLLEDTKVRREDERRRWKQQQTQQDSIAIGQAQGLAGVAKDAAAAAAQFRPQQQPAAA